MQMAYIYNKQYLHVAQSVIDYLQDKSSDLVSKYRPCDVYNKDNKAEHLQAIL